MKIVITGGHHQSALAVIEALNKKNKHKYLWFGHRHSVWKDKSDSLEYKEIKAYGIPFVDLKAGKLYRTFNPLKLARIPRGFVNAFYHLLKFRPDCILSFGGYLAAPTAIAAWIMKIPVYTHEQTAVVGWSNRLVGKIAKKVFVTWPESLIYFDKEKGTYTGLPLRQELLALVRKNVSNRSKIPTIYVTGGKQGSHFINMVVKDTLPSLLNKFKVIHQCGSVSLYHDKEILKQTVLDLAIKLQKNYKVQEYFISRQAAEVFEECDFVVTRGGAHTIYELSALAKPAIIIPIPWVSHEEQLRNAQIIETAGFGIIVKEKDLDSKSLLKACSLLLNDFDEFKNKALIFSKTIPLNAGELIAAEIVRYYEKKKRANSL
jgi:UDP-N-acetylglucosamine--N-acetylmuramyl-(pentapeptide) pyrophosphoryl-undecaprenol N-acetylglucosamine transferase